MLLKSWKRRQALRILLVIGLQVAFIVAKLTGILAWPWLWVFAPLLLTGTVLLVFLFTAGVIVILIGD